MILNYTVLSVLLVSAIALFAVLGVASNIRRLRQHLLILVSFSTGALFGDVFFHLIPASINRDGFNNQIALSLLFGIVISFVIEKIIHWRHCHLPSEEENHLHPFALMNLWGDGVHNFIDGLIIGASYLASIPTGIATTLAVILHEIPQEIGDSGVLLKGGASRNRVILFNVLTALTALVGALAALALGTLPQNITSFLVPFAAGNFIYIAGADLIPELHKEVKVKNSLLQLIALIMGAGIMYSLLFFE